MKITYALRALSQEEQELLEQILLDEMNLQAWYTVACSELLNEELFVVLH